MSINSNLKRLIVVAGLLLATPLVALAEAPPPGPEHGAAAGPHGHGMAECPLLQHGMAHFGGGFDEGGAMPHFLGKLQLTEAQQDQIFGIMHAQAPKAREQAKALRSAHRSLHELVTSANYDDAKAKALADTLAKAMAELTLLHARTHHQVYEVLTPEQRQALERHAGHHDENDEGSWHHGDHSEMHPQ